MTVPFNIEVSYVIISGKRPFLFQLKEIPFRRGQGFKEFFKNEMFNDVFHMPYSR